MHDQVPSWKPSDTLSTQLDGQPAIWAPGENDQSRSLPEGSVGTRCYNSALAAYHETYRSALGPGLGVRVPHHSKGRHGHSQRLRHPGRSHGRHRQHYDDKTRGTRYTMRRGEELTDWSCARTSSLTPNSSKSDRRELTTSSMTPRYIWGYHSSAEFPISFGQSPGSVPTNVRNS